MPKMLLMNSRLSYALMSDAPLSQARLATALQTVESQIQLLAEGHDVLERRVS